MLSQAKTLVAVTKPEPVDQPLLALISLSALEAKNSAMMANTSGHRTHEAMASTNAMIAFWFVVGTAGGGAAG